jgi:hypothetical protein
MLGMILIAIVFTVGPLPWAHLANDCWGGETVQRKEDIIQGVLGNFQLFYYSDKENRGRTFSLVIKDFDLDDEETYAISEKEKRFWVIDLQQVRDKHGMLTGICCKEFPLRKVREELVMATRAKGLKRPFTVPLRKEDMPR